MHIYCLRHFQTKNNKKGLLNGENFSVPIEKGEPIIFSSSIDMVLCSPALRCYQTLHYLISSMPVCKVVYTKQLLERNLGDLEGKSRVEMARQYPDIFNGNRLSIFSTPPNGESFSAFYNRILEIKKICYKYESKNILVCSHNQTLKMLYFILTEKEITQNTWEALSFPYGKITQLF